MIDIFSPYFSLKLYSVKNYAKYIVTETYILAYSFSTQEPNSPESFIRFAKSRRAGSSSFFFFFFAFLMSVGDCEGCGGGVGVDGCGTAISAGPDEVCICCNCNVWPDDISLTSC